MTASKKDDYMRGYGDGWKDAVAALGETGMVPVTGKERPMLRPEAASTEARFETASLHQPSQSVDCPYCGATEGLRMKHDGGGYTAPEYTCEADFTPTDDGPCFDDLPEAPPMSMEAILNGKTVTLTGLALEVFWALSRASIVQSKEAFHRGFKGAVPDGFVVVPKEPTIWMSAAGMRYIKEIPEHHFSKYAGGIANSVYGKMVEAYKPSTRQELPEPIAVFGHGNLGVDTGTVHGVPAVFIRKNEKPGPVGERCEDQGPLDRLALWEIYMTFPTMEQAKAVAAAMVTPAPQNTGN